MLAILGYGGHVEMPTNIILRNRYEELFDNPISIGKKSGKGDPMGLRNKMNSSQKQKWLK